MPDGFGHETGPARVGTGVADADHGLLQLRVPHMQGTGQHLDGTGDLGHGLVHVPLLADFWHVAPSADGACGRRERRPQAP